MVATSRRHEHKRHGRHQRRTKDFSKVYWPYIPLVLIISLGLIFSAAWQPHTRRGVLAYATNMSTSGLLQSTNQQRTANKKTSLSSSSKLNQAAQAKANDMVKKDYWSHNTPDGNSPWVFIEQAGYRYSMAGENLAYGFLTSADTVSGWMNSASHKANLLNKDFTQVGFGYANSSDYQGDGNQTVVVAMYAKPIATSSPAAAPVSSGTTKSVQTTQNANTNTRKATPTPTAEKKEAKKAKKPSPTEEPVTTFSTALAEPQTKSISRLAALTYGSLPWLASAVTLITVASAAAFVLRHSIAIHRWIRRGERYMLHHVVFDITIVSLLGLVYIISQTAGFIK